NLTYDSSTIYYESLKKKTSRLYSRVFEREKLNANSETVLTGAAKKLTSQIRENASVISTAAQFNDEDIAPAYEFFSSVKSNINNWFGRVPTLFGVSRAVNLYKRSPDLLKRVTQLIKSWDIDIDNLEFKDIPLANREQDHTQAYVIHRFGDKTIRLRLEQESSGTQSLFSLLALLLPAIDSGGIAIIDELESDLHPLMLDAILDLFLRPETNPKNAQIIFTTHAAEIINRFHKPQILLVEKNGAYSDAWSLNDMTGVEARENHAAKYLAGAYGAIPEL
uniref:AAA family ATPase n=1 Tax=Chromobacterium haemolyticum TaxID=394935 RepID=UPI0012FB3CD9